jgi:hypothetical protein
MATLSVKLMVMADLLSWVMCVADSIAARDEWRAAWHGLYVYASVKLQI